MAREASIHRKKEKQEKRLKLLKKKTWGKLTPKEKETITDYLLKSLAEDGGLVLKK